MLDICNIESLSVFNSISQFLFRIRTVVQMSVYIINNTKYFILVDDNYIKIKYHATCRDYGHQHSFFIWIVNYSIVHNIEYKNLCISSKTDITSYSHIFLQFRITAFHRFIRFYQCNWIWLLFVFLFCCLMFRVHNWSILAVVKDMKTIWRLIPQNA